MSVYDIKIYYIHYKLSMNNLMVYQVLVIHLVLSIFIYCDFVTFV